MTAPGVPVELDGYAADLLATYADTTRQIRDLEAIRVKARDQLMDWMALRGAAARVVGFVDDAPAVRYTEFEINTFDVPRFREDQPALAAAYSQLKPSRRLTVLT